MASTFPLSPFQLPFWIAWERARGSSEGNRGVALRIDGAVDVAAFESAWNEVVARHDVLRATYRRGPRGPEHVILDAIPGALTIERADGWSAEAVQRRVQAAVDTPFDLERGPVIRGLLLCRGGVRPESVFAFVSHHIQADVTIVDIVLGELGQALDARTAGGPPLPPVKSAPYARFVEEQVAALRAERLRALDDFWQSRTKEAAPELALPRGRPARADRPRRLATHAFVLLEPASAAALRDVCDRTQCTRYRFLLACYQAWLARLGTRRPVVGMSVSRATREYDGTIGNYANVVPLVADVDLDETISGLAARTASEVRLATEHSDAPFAAAAGGGGLAFRTMFGFGKLRRAPSLTPIYLAAQPLPWEGRLGPLRVEGSIPIDQHGLTVDIELLLCDVGPAVAAQLDYDAETFDAVTVASMAKSLSAFVGAAIATPSASIAALPLFDAEERERLLRAGAGPSVAVEPDTVLASFLVHARSAPDRVAVIEPDGVTTTTYGRLDARVRAIAHGLRARGVVPGDRVAVMLPRGVAPLAAFLGCWRAGVTYVPVDPSSPADRIERILALAGAKLVVGDTGTTLAELEAAGADVDVEAPLPNASPDSIAYVIFTSGSTGAPKGVVVAHRGVASYAQDVRARWGLTPASRVSAFASFAFDSSISDWCGALAAGATLAIRGSDLMGGTALHAFLAKHAITHAHLPPAVWATLPRRPLPALEVAVTSGDACPIEVVRAWAPGRRMLNEYGPTEITVCATSADCVPDEEPTIGTPIANVRTYVLDERLEPLPDGVIGELVLGGIGLARGYLGDERLTQERFVSVAFPDDTRVYRTGDCVRRRRDGRLEFHGRTDDQIKIRGHRVEPSEVEHALERLPSVHRAVVIGRHDVGPNVKLVAYVVPAPDASVAPDALRRALNAVLPSYLVPSVFLVLDALPLTPHGKVDREALPRPTIETSLEIAQPSADATPAAPDDGEARALAIFRAVLGASTFGADDNFFEHGGDSLMAVDLADRLAAAFATEVAVIDLFEMPSPRGWAKRFVGDAGSASRAPTHVSPGDTAILFVPPPGGDAAIYRPLLQHPALAGRSVALALDDAASLEELVDTLVRDANGAHAGAVIVAGWSVGGIFARALAERLERAMPGRVRALVLFDAYSPDAVERHLGVERARALAESVPMVTHAMAVAPKHRRLASTFAPGEVRLAVHHLRAKASAAIPEWNDGAVVTWIDASHDGIVAASTDAFLEVVESAPAK